MKIHVLLVFTLLCVFVAGCAEIEVPKSDQLLKAPLGDGPLVKGMTKYQVVSIYGEPKLKSTVRSSEWGGPREEWFYSAQYTVLPVNAGYLSEDLYLYFDGENLTNISQKPLGKRVQEDAKDVEETVK
ncbi:MAG: hypothetical protein ABID83_04825 [Candidatus Omnitrophota bacterium]